MRRFLTVFLAFFVLSLVLPQADAVEEARELTGAASFSADVQDLSFLTDGTEAQSRPISRLTVEAEGMGALYLVFDQPCGPYTVENAATGETVAAGGQGFLHDLVELSDADSVTVQFPDSVPLCEVRVYSTGTLPDNVQRWEQPLTGEADIVLFSTHGDDEQLYFAGMLPLYAGEKGLGVQVVYMTGHDNNYGAERRHEMLNGLWAVGVRNYPVFGPFADFKILDREETYTEYENLGFSRADLLRYVVENIRRFRPLVAVGHDLNGEYGHGMHMVYADLLTQAVQVSADAGTFSESAERYGVWDVPKTYLHLYGEGEIVLDYDQPLARFGGMTAFEVTQKLGFPCHISQQYPLYTNWLYGADGSITSAAQISQWSPCRFGLYRSTVGEDTGKHDLMENLTSHAEMAKRDRDGIRRLREQVAQARAGSAQPVAVLRPEEAAELPAKAPFPTASAILAAICAAALLMLPLTKKYFEKK